MLENALIFVKVFDIFWNIYRYFLSSRCRTFISQYSKQFYKAKLYIAMIAILKRPKTLNGAWPKVSVKKY